MSDSIPLPEPQFTQPSQNIGRQDLLEQFDVELVLHEIGELLVGAAVSTRRELQRYQSKQGHLQLSEFEIELPVKMRVDRLGQLRAIVVSEISDTDAIARIKLGISSSSEPSDTKITASQSLQEFVDLTDEQASVMAKHRIFTGEDLRRVTRTVAGFEGIKAVIGFEKLGKALETVDFALTPGLTPEVSTALIRAGIKSRQDLLDYPTNELALKLSSLVGNEVSPTTISELKSYIQGNEK